MVTYFLQPVVTPDGPDSRLMRQLGAHPPVPVAEHIEDLQFTYDIVDDNTGVLLANLPNAISGIPQLRSPTRSGKSTSTLRAELPAWDKEQRAAREFVLFRRSAKS